MDTNDIDKEHAIEATDNRLQAKGPVEDGIWDPDDDHAHEATDDAAEVRDDGERDIEFFDIETIDDVYRLLGSHAKVASEIARRLVAKGRVDNDDVACALAADNVVLSTLIPPDDIAAVINGDDLTDVIDRLVRSRRRLVVYYWGLVNPDAIHEIYRRSNGGSVTPEMCEDIVIEAFSGKRPLFDPIDLAYAANDLRGHGWAEG